MQKVKKNQTFTYKSLCEYMGWSFSEEEREDRLNLLSDIAEYHIEENGIIMIDKVYRKPKNDQISLVVLSMGDIEYQKFDKLYQYIRSEIMKYPNDSENKKALTRNMTMRIKGLRKGQYFLHYNNNEIAEYTYDVILATFRLYKREIEQGFSRNSFVNDDHKFNYAMKIVESNINNVIDRIHHIKQEKIKKEQLRQENDKLHDVSSMSQDNGYVARHKKINKKLENLM